MANPNYDQILATTLANHKDNLVDNVFTARPLAFALKEAGQIRQIGGGHKIVLPLIHALNETASSYAGADTLSTDPSEGISAAEFNWKQFYVTITITGIQEAMNSSVEQVIDLLEAKTMQAEETITEVLNQQFYGDGTGNSGKDFNGLGNLVAQNSTPVGGIDPATNDFWRSYIDSDAEPLTVSKMTRAYNTVSVGADQPQWVITEQELYEKYESLLQPQARYTNMKVADAGFQNLMFKAAPVTYDVHCPAGNMNFLNTKYLRLVGHKDVWFRPTPFIRPEDVDAKYANILLYGELTISNRKRQGVLTNKTN